MVGAKGLARGVVEWRSRVTGEERELALDAPVEDAGGPPGLIGGPVGGGPGGRRPTGNGGETARQGVHSSEAALLYFQICRSVGVK